MAELEEGYNRSITCYSANELPTSSIELNKKRKLQNELGLPLAKHKFRDRSGDPTNTEEPLASPADWPDYLEESDGDSNSFVGADMVTDEIDVDSSLAQAYQVVRPAALPIISSGGSSSSNGGCCCHCWMPIFLAGLPHRMGRFLRS